MRDRTPVSGYRLLTETPERRFDVTSSAFCLSLPVNFLSVSNPVSVLYYLLAECVALWGDPEQAVNGMKERRKQWHEGAKRNNLHGLLLLNLRGVYLHSSDLRCLSG